MLSRCQRAAIISKAANSCFLPAASTSSSVSSGQTRPVFARGLSSDNRDRSSGGSIFSTSSTQSGWDEIFRKDDAESIMPREAHDTSRAPRRQIMTERESKAVSGMLDMIFDKKRTSQDAGTESEGQAGIGGGQIDDLVGRLRRHTRPLRWSVGPSSSLADEKKEQMSHCNSDQELLLWAQREVFEESKRYEEAARKAMEEAPSKSGSAKELPMLQSPVYPQMIAHLMRTFRVHYKDPNLALFIFHHAQKLSVVSYVFGCSTEAYNELIETRWSCFKDVQGVYSAVHEMVVNGVPINYQTRKIVENMRRDIGSIVEMREDAVERVRHGVWETFMKIEQLVASQAVSPDSVTASQPPKTWEQWKSNIAEDGVDDWSFDNWSIPSKLKSDGYNGQQYKRRARA